ncbi:hypothetical protein ACQHIV_14345 [Kribbella sp. GL6]|uniref:hypothetical protein n=1 Tax=Kribbella sp. GL6 TaxID=3419765 RepID=UPI003CFF4369
MRILPVAHATHQIQFTSDPGETVMGWRGAAPPVLGEPVDVELDIDDTLHWSEIAVVDAEPGFFRSPAAVARLRVIALADDGVLTLSVGGAVLLLETYGPPPDGVVGRVLEVESARLAAYPTGV